MTIKRITAESKKRTTDILKQIKTMLDKPLLLPGFDAFILGYDIQTTSVIYDGLGITNSMAHALMADDEKHGTSVDDFNEYYDRAYEFVCSGLIESASIHQFKGVKWVDKTADQPKPIIMMQF